MSAHWTLDTGGVNQCSRLLHMIIDQNITDITLTPDCCNHWTPTQIFLTFLREGVIYKHKFVYTYTKFKLQFFYPNKYVFKKTHFCDKKIGFAVHWTSFFHHFNLYEFLIIMDPFPNQSNLMRHS